MLSILHRMIFWELARIFAMSLTAITGILVMAGLVTEATQQGLNAAQIVGVIPLLVPSTLPYTIPATTLFATCLVYGRLAHDNEILAIKAAGVNVLYVIWPALLLGLLMSVATFALYYHLIPRTHYLLRVSVMNAPEEYMYAVLRRDRCIKQPGFNYAMWVQQVQGRRLVEALFKRMEQGNTGYDLIAKAREAYLSVDMNYKDPVSGETKPQIIVHMRHGQVLGGDDSRGYFEDRKWAVPLPDNFDKQRVLLRPRAMTWQQLIAHHRGLVTEIDELGAEIATHSARLAMTAVPLSPSEVKNKLPEHVQNLKQKQFYRVEELYDVVAELHMRPALSLSAFFFVLVGCPVGIWFSRSDYLSAFITCFLPIVFLYYPLVLCGTNLAKDGWDPLLAIWAADSLLIMIAPFLFWQLTKH